MHEKLNLSTSTQSPFINQSTVAVPSQIKLENNSQNSFNAPINPTTEVTKKKNKPSNKQIKQQVNATVENQKTNKTTGQTKVDMLKLNEVTSTSCNPEQSNSMHIKNLLANSAIQNMITHQQKQIPPQSILSTVNPFPANQQPVNQQGETIHHSVLLKKSNNIKGKSKAKMKLKCNVLSRIIRHAV